MYATPTFIIEMFHPVTYVQRLLIALGADAHTHVHIEQLRG